MRVRRTIDELVGTLRGTGATFEVIAVSDGSTDGSEASLRGLPPNLVRTVRLDQNQGQGGSVADRVHYGPGTVHRAQEVVRRLRLTPS